MPKTVCQQCTNVIQTFNKFCIEVEHHQNQLKLSLLQGGNNEVQTVETSNDSHQLSSEINSKCIGNVMIASQTRSESNENINGVDLSESDDSDNNIEDENGDEYQIRDEHLVTKNVNTECKDFPTKLIEGCKLLFKGQELLEIISKFYRLDCDQCE